MGDLYKQPDPGQDVITAGLLIPRQALGLSRGSPWTGILLGPAEAISHRARPSSLLSSPLSLPVQGDCISTSIQTRHSWVLWQRPNINPRNESLRIGYQAPWQLEGKQLGLFPAPLKFTTGSGSACSDCLEFNPEASFYAQTGRLPILTFSNSIHKGFEAANATVTLRSLT